MTGCLGMLIIMFVNWGLSYWSCVFCNCGSLLKPVQLYYLFMNFLEYAYTVHFAHITILGVDKKIV